MPDLWLSLPLSLKVKLGSIAVHADELLSPSGHRVDEDAIRGLLADPEVQMFLAQGHGAALLPVKRQ